MDHGQADNLAGQQQEVDSLVKYLVGSISRLAMLGISHKSYVNCSFDRLGQESTSTIALLDSAKPYSAWPSIRILEKRHLAMRS